MKTDNLFRKEVSQVSRGKLYGKVYLARPKIYLVASMTALVILGLLVVGAGSVPIKHRALAFGLVVTGQGTSNISTPILGVVSEIYAKEGDEVMPGMPLIKVTNEVQTDGVVSSSQAILGSLEARRQTFEMERIQAVRRTKKMSTLLQEKLSAYDSEIERINALGKLEDEKYSLLQHRERDTLNLAEANFVSKSQVVDRQLDVLNQKARVEDLGRQLQGHHRARLSTAQELEVVRADGINVAESLARSIAAIDQEATEVKQRGERVLRSPRGGTVTGLLPSVGNTVSPGQLLAVVVPSQGKLGAEVYVPAKAISHISAGMEVEIRYEAFPYQKYGQYLGRISSITNIPIQPNEFSNVPGVRAAIIGLEPVYRVNIEIPQQRVGEQPLRPGMALSAAVISEEKTIWRRVTDDFYQTIKPVSSGI